MEIRTISDEDNQDVRNKIGARLKAERESIRSTLRQVSDSLTKRGFSISAAQISRIENGEVAADTDQLNAFAKFYKIQLSELLDPSVEPFFVIRNGVAHDRLQDVLDGRLKFTRRGHSHNEMEEKVYYHVPLHDDPAFVKDVADHQGKMNPVMQKLLFYVGRANDDEIRLDSHSGEEIIYVIEGQIDFWYEQNSNTATDDSGKRKSIRLYKGDILQFSSQLKHAFVNSGKDDFAEALFVFAEVLNTPDLYESELPNPTEPDKEIKQND